MTLKLSQPHLAWTLALLTFRRVLKRRSTWVFLGIGLFPCLIFLFWLLAQAVPDIRPGTKPFGMFRLIQSIYFLSFYVPLLSLFLGLGAISDEIETKSITFTLTRPLNRYSIAFGRFFGHLMAAITLLAVSVLGLYMSNMLFQVEDMFTQIPHLINGLFVLSFGTAAYLALVALWGTLIRRFAMLISLLWIILDILFSLFPFGWMKFINVRYRMLASYWEMLPQFIPGLIPVQQSSALMNFAMCMSFVVIACWFMGFRLSFEIVLSDASK